MTNYDPIIANAGVKTQPLPIWTPFVHSDLRVAVSGRSLGNTNRRYGSAALAHANRLALAAATDSAELAAMWPLGTDTFVDIDTLEADDSRIVHNDELGEAPEAEVPVTDIKCDALITTKKAAGLLLGAADCASLVLYDATAEALAHVHVGRPGAELNIASKVITYLQGQKGAEPSRMIAHFGPAIKPSSYVMPMRGPALKGSEWDEHINQVEDGFEVDFVGRAVTQLLDHNVEPRNISTTDIDVYSDPEFFSLVETKTTGVPIGRNGFVVAMTSH